MTALTTPLRKLNLNRLTHFGLPYDLTDMETLQRAPELLGLGRGAALACKQCM